jgi:predicted MFS family arabinose efflux permease
MTLPHAAVPPISWLIALTVCNHVAFNASRVVVSLFAISLKASTVTLGILMSLYALLPMFLAIRAGKRIDEIGPRLPMTAGSLMVVAGTLLPAVWHDLASLYAACALIGVGFMLVQVAMQLLIGQVSTNETRLRNYTWHALGLSISGTLGPVAMGYTIEHAGFRTAFCILVGVALLGQAGLQYVRPRLPATGGNAGRIAIEDGSRHSTLDLLQHPELRAVFVASAVLSAAWDLHAFLIPIQGTRIGLSPSMIGWVLGAFSIATLAIRIAMPMVSRHFSEWKIIRLALLVGALAYVFYPFVSQFWLMCGLAFVLGLALGSAQPNVMNILHTASPSGRAGEALGLRSAVLNTSQVVWPLTFGVVGTALGMLPIFLSMAGAMGMANYYSRRQGRKIAAPELPDQRPANS